MKIILTYFNRMSISGIKAANNTDGSRVKHVFDVSSSGKTDAEFDIQWNKTDLREGLTFKTSFVATLKTFAALLAGHTR